MSPVCGQLISIYFQSIFNWFWNDFNLVSIDFEIMSIFFQSLLIWFQLISFCGQLISNYFQIIFNLFSIYFQFTFKLLSIDFELISAYWARGVLIRGTLVINHGGHGLMGGTFLKLPRLMFFIKNLIQNRSVEEGWYVEFLQWLAVIWEIKKSRTKKNKLKKRKEIEHQLTN